MGKIFATQRVEIVFNYDAADAPPADATLFKIRYRKPLGIMGVFAPAEHNAATRTISYIGPMAGKYGMAGNWTFWPVAVTDAGVEYPGEPRTITIYAEGT